MIDWNLVATSGLWILGASILVAAFSYHQWLAGERGRGLRHQWRERSWQLSFAGGLLLICVGLGLSAANHWWERIVWLALAVVFAVQGVQVLRHRERPNGS